MSKNIEVEGGEIAIQNESGDIAIIPIKDVARVKKMLKNPAELDEYITGLPKMADYAEEGTVVNKDENNNTDSPLLNDFIIDVDNPKVLDKYAAKYKNIHKTSNPKRDEQGKVIPGEYSIPGCVAGALNCNTDLVASKLGKSPIRKMINDTGVSPKDSKYSLPSKPLHSLPKDFAPNQSIDAWEMADFMEGENIGTSYYEKGEGTTYDKYKTNLPSDLDYKNIPLGAVILQGDAEGEYIPEGIKGKARHLSTVVGFDKDGVPLTYDYGKIRRVTNSMHPITKVITPKGYENYSYSKMTDTYKKKASSLGYKENVSREKYSNPSVNTIYKSLDEVATRVGVDNNISKNTMELLKDRVVGIGVQESNLGNTGDEDVSALREAKIALDSTAIGNSIFKPQAKIIESVKNFIGNSSNVKPRQDWEVEIVAHEKSKGDKEKFKSYYKHLREAIPSPSSKSVNLESSVGPFSIKDMPDYAKNKFNINKEDLYGINKGMQEELNVGAKASLSHLVENYNKLKKKYKSSKLTDEQLVDLATVAYNNNSKVDHPLFVKHYIENSDLKDNYLTKVKNYSKKYKK
jgi:hypothetical protein